MPAAHPIFGRDVPDAVWRPGPDLLADARLAGFLRSTGEHDLERLQARAVADPGEWHGWCSFPEWEVSSRRDGKTKVRCGTREMGSGRRRLVREVLDEAALAQLAPILAAAPPMR